MQKYEEYSIYANLFLSPACGVIQKSCFFMLPAARKSCKSWKSFWIVGLPPQAGRLEKGIYVVHDIFVGAP